MKYSNLPAGAYFIFVNQVKKVLKLNIGRVTKYKKIILLPKNKNGKERWGILNMSDYTSFEVDDKISKSEIIQV